MSFLFHKKTKKVMNFLWTFFAVIIIIGMVLFFAPGVVNLFVF